MVSSKRKKWRCTITARVTFKQLAKIRFLQSEHNLHWINRNYDAMPLWIAIKIIDSIENGNFENGYIYQYMYFEPEFFKEYCDTIIENIEKYGYVARKEVIKNFEYLYRHLNITSSEAIFRFKLRIKEYEKRFLQEYAEYTFLHGKTKEYLEGIGVPSNYYSSVVYIKKTEAIG